MQAAVLERVDDSLVDIHPDDFDSVSGKSAGGWQPDIAQAEDTDLLKIHIGS